MRFPPRPPPAGAAAPAARPRLHCTRCGRTRHAIRVWGSTRHVYACPAGCDDFDPARGLV